MDPKHKAAIQKHFVSLVTQTDLREMVESLYEKGVFAENMIEPYQGVNDTHHKRMFYLHLMRRGPDAFRHLIDTLWEKGLWALARDLDPRGDYHDRPLVPRSQRASNDEDFISISAEKKKAKSEAETKKVPVAAPPPPRPPSPPPPLPPLESASASASDPPPFDVKKCTEPILDEGNDIKQYSVRGARRQRVMLLYTYMNFSNDIEAPRRGADRDSASLKYLFHELGFQVVSFFDHKKEETLESLQNLSSTLEGASCVFAVVSSHGYDRYGSSDNDFRCSDGQLFSFYEFIEHFSNKALPQLSGVPKVFIFQTCRGKKDSYWSMPPAHVRMPARDGARGYSHEHEARGSHSAPASPHVQPDGAHAYCDQRRASSARIYSDILIAHSTVPGYVSNRIPEEGSWYVQTLCHVFAEHAHNRHVEELLTLVDQEMERRYRLQTSSVDKWGFNRRLYLQPGLDQ